MSIRIFVGVSKNDDDIHEGGTGSSLRPRVEGHWVDKCYLPKVSTNYLGCCWCCLPLAIHYNNLLLPLLGPDHVQLTLLNWDTESVLVLNKKLKVN